MMIRGNMKNWFMLVALVFVMFAVGEVWGIRAASAATPAKPIKLRMMIPSEPFVSAAGGEPLFQQANPMTEYISLNVLEPLIDVGKKGEPIPKLATKWEHSKDLTKWRFYLRKGVKFHNGDDFSARDVVEYAKFLIKIKEVSTTWARWPIKEAVAIDDYTVDFIFATPQPLSLINGRRFFVPPVAASRDNWSILNRVAIGTGPYRFVEWNRGLNIKLTKFEGYWGPKPQIDDVEIIFRAEEAVRLAALMAGEVDWVSQIGSESASSAPKVVHMPSPETVWLRFDEYIQKELGRESILADKRLRQAIEYSIDRQALLALYGGLATPSQGQFGSPGDFGFNPNLKSRPYDLEKARALVKEAGAVGKTLTAVATPDKFAKDREVAEAIASMIEKTGLKIKLMVMPASEAIKYLRVDGKNRPYMADISQSSTETLLETEARYDAIFVEGGRQYALNDLEPTRLFNEVLAEIDYSKRQEKLARTWAYVYEQAHYVPLFKLEWIWGIAKNLEWNLDIAGRPFFTDMRFTDKR